MTRLFTLFAVSALAAATFGASARSLTPAEALAAAKSEMPQSGPARVAASADFALTPALTVSAPDGQPTLYLFAAQQGYIVAAADDAAGAALLGFSDTGRFDAADVPPQMRWWLDELSEQVAYAAAHPGEELQLAPARAERQQIAPIAKTLWNQDAPYNDLCPVLKNSSGVQSRAVTGCVATAMAQAIKVFNYPQQGLGSHSYNFTYLNNNYSASFDFAGTPFAWDQMSDTYDSSSSSASNEAVATLMKACGVSVDMSYGLAATGGSGASTFNAASALVDYFNYDPGVRYLSRECYTSSDWIDMVYNEIAAGRPVIYSGHSNEGGHAFVCDGYSQDDFFHINWGWGGMSNGYFKLSVLDPPSQGIGGSNSGFNMGQGIIIGICPPGSAGAIGQVVPIIELSGDFAPAQTQYSKSSTVVFGSSETLFYNASTAAIPVTLGLKLTNESTGAVSYISAYNTVNSLPSLNGWRQMSINGSSFPVGTYKAEPAFQSNDTWYDVSTSINTPGYVQAVVTNSTITFTVPSTAQHAHVTSCTMLTPIYIGDAAEFEVDIEASADYYGTVIPALASGTSVYATGSRKGLSLDAGETLTIDWVATFSGSNLSAGNYDLVFITEDYYLISDRYPVTVLAAQTTSPAAQVVSVEFPGCAGYGTSSSPFIIDPNGLECWINLKGTSGYWADNVEAMFFDVATGRSLTSMGSVFAGIQAGETVNLKYQGDVSGLVAGNTYYFVPWGSTKGQLSNPYYVKASTTGIDTVAAEASTAARYYTLQGTEVAEPQPGQIYIVVKGNIATKQIF